jgi:hypothetical protein
LLWEDPPDTAIGDGAHADGRALLLRLSPWHLWLDRPEDAAEAAPPDSRTVRGRRLRAPIQLVRLARGRVRVMIVARASTVRTVVHTRHYRTYAR